MEQTGQRQHLPRDSPRDRNGVLLLLLLVAYDVVVVAAVARITRACALLFVAYSRVVCDYDDVYSMVGMILLLHHYVVVAGSLSWWWWLS
jgi:hypothetical protein